MNRDHFHPCPRADPVTDRRPEVSQHMSLVPTSQREFPKWDQTSGINIHAPAPLIG